MNKIKFNKINKEIQKNIINILINKFNYIFKKNILYINHIYLNKNFSFIKIYINFYNYKNYIINKKIIYILQKSEKYIKNNIIKKTYFKYLPKIYFKIDNFYKKKKRLFNLLKKIKK